MNSVAFASIINPFMCRPATLEDELQGRMFSGYSLEGKMGVIILISLYVNCLLLYLKLSIEVFYKIMIGS